MSTKDIIKLARGFAEPFKVTEGGGFRFKDVDPGDTLDLGSEEKPLAKEALATGVQALAELQDMLYAQDRWAMLLIFQAMDAAGKDGTIKHVMSGWGGERLWSIANGSLSTSSCSARASTGPA